MIRTLFSCGETSCRWRFWTTLRILASLRLGSLRCICRQISEFLSSTKIQKRPHIVETEPFSETFGPKAQRKRPRVDAGTFEELGQIGATMAEEAENAASLSGTRIIGT